MAISEYVRESFKKNYGMTPKQVADNMAKRCGDVALVGYSIRPNQQTLCREAISAEFADRRNREILRRW